MAIPARDDGNNFKRAKPPEGRNNLVCVDVWDPGQYKANGDPSDSTDGMVEKPKRVNGVVVGTERKYMVNIVFVVGDRQGNPLRDPETGWLLTVTQKFNNTLHENGYLSKFIKAWLNNKKDLTEAQLAALKADLERPLLGRTGEGSLVYNGEFTNIDWVEALPEGYTPMKIPQDYVRVQDRAAQRATQAQQQPAGHPRQQQSATPPAHAPQTADANAFAQAGSDDVFGGPALAAKPASAPARQGYDDFQAPPMDGRTPEEMDPNHPDFLPF
jgi:hypothetical protein